MSLAIIRLLMLLMPTNEQQNWIPRILTLKLDCNSCVKARAAGRWSKDLHLYPPMCTLNLMELKGRKLRNGQEHQLHLHNRNLAVLQLALEEPMAGVD